MRKDLKNRKTMGNKGWKGHHLARGIRRIQEGAEKSEWKGEAVRVRERGRERK